MNVEYCPECNTELTRSIVGYLCHGCGSVYGFEKVASMPISSSAPSKHKKSVHSRHSKFAVVQPDMHPEKIEATKKPGKIRHKVKKFVVPQIAEIKSLENTAELPAPPIEEQGLPARLAEAAPPPKPSPTDMPVMPPEETYADHHSEYNPHLTEKALSELNKDYSPVTTENNAGSYILPTLAALLVIGALIIAYMVIR